MSTFPRYPWIVILVASLIGMVATVEQIVEKITILKNPSTTLICDVNEKLSCSNVLNASQSSVLGPPNSSIGLILFTLFFTVSAAVLLKNTLNVLTLKILLGLSLFFTSFATWFMYQTAFNINALCLWCTLIFTATLTTSFMLTVALAKASNTGFVYKLVVNKTHYVLFIGWFAAVAAMLYAGLMF